MELDRELGQRNDAQPVGSTTSRATAVIATTGSYSRSSTNGIMTGSSQHQRAEGRREQSGTTASQCRARRRIPIRIRSRTVKAWVERTSQATITWNGCIEERADRPQTTYDANSDQAATISTSTWCRSPTRTHWRPACPADLYALYEDGIQFEELARLAYGLGLDTTTELRPTTTKMVRNSLPDRGTASSRPGPTANTFRRYVDSLDTDGNTYHDIGLLWGARLFAHRHLRSGEATRRKAARSSATSSS